MQALCSGHNANKRAAAGACSGRAPPAPCRLPVTRGQQTFPCPVAVVRDSNSRAFNRKGLRQQRLSVVRWAEGGQGGGDPAQTHPFPEEADYDLLSKKVAALTQELDEQLCGCSIYLVGMMGSGKTTVSASAGAVGKYVS